MGDEEVRDLLKKIEVKLPKVDTPVKHMEAIRAFHEYADKSKSIGNTSWSKAIQSYFDATKRMESLSKTLVQRGVIRNQEALASAMRTSIFMPNLNLMSTLKLSDSLITMQKVLADNAEALRKITIPHMPLYESIITSIDESWVEQLQDEVEQFSFVDIENNGDVPITRPYFYDAAVKINLYMTVTNDHMENSEEVTEEQKTLWKKFVSPVLIFISQIFMTWAMGDTPLSNMQIVQQFERVVELIEDYQYPIETTDVLLREEGKE